MRRFLLVAGLLFLAVVSARAGGDPRRETSPTAQALPPAGADATDQLTFYFAHLNTAGAIQALRAGADPNALRSGWAPVHAWGRTRNDDPELVKLMLEKHPNLNLVSPLGTTPLHKLLAGGDNNRSRKAVANLLKVFIQADADPNIRDGNGVSPFDLAVERHSPAIVKMLLDSGRVKVNDADPRTGNTPLHVLVAGGCRHKEWLAAKIAALREAGADLSIKNRAGQTPKELATVRGCSGAAGAL